MWALFSLSGIGIFTYKFGFIFAALILLLQHTEDLMNIPLH